MDSPTHPRNEKPSAATPSIFDSHWKNEKLQNTPPSKKKTATAFLESSGIDFSKLPDSYKILDAGCGNGVHAEVLKETAGNSQFYGIDISSSAIKHCIQKFPNWGHFSVGDITKMNFENNSFDLTLCYGVLFYTHDPAETLRELKRVTKEQGMIGIWFMPNSPGTCFKIFKAFRGIFRLLGPRVSTVLLHSLVPLLFFIPTASRINLRNATWNECLEVLKINFIPQVQFPTPEELVNLLKSSGLKIVRKDDRQNLALWLKHSEI